MNQIPDDVPAPVHRLVGHVIDETRQLEELMEAQAQLKAAAATIDRVANKVHGNAVAFSNIEKERLRQQTRANDEAVINCKINEDFDLAMEEWRNEQRKNEQVINKWTVISRESPSDNMTYHAPTILAVLRDLVPNAQDDREPYND